MRKLPIGVQDFEKLITKNFIYVDKTEYIYQLVQQNTPIFLSRPRRFGKSLLVSTLKAYWQGKKELFKGLKIEELLEQSSSGSEDSNTNSTNNTSNTLWLPHPVFHFDFNKENYREDFSRLETILDNHLTDWESIYGNKFHYRPLGERFYKLLQLAC